MVVSNGGNYTKHIYMGSQRITSKVSNSGIFTTSPVKDTLQAKYATLTTKIKERFDTLGVTYSGIQQTGSLVSGNPVTTASSYFYHSDHLGSSSLITDITGAMVQHVEYVPFGETFIDERRSASSWTTPYLFNAKERDDETGLHYYHARYYDSRTSVWLSVDPLAEKKPFISSYVYCRNNPINMIDPDGRDEWDVNSKGKVVNHTVNKKNDVFHIVDDKGNRIKGKSIEFKYGTIKTQEEFLYIDKDAMVKETNIFKINGSRNSSKLFEFLATNTKVEYSLIKFKGFNLDPILTTSHEESIERVGYQYLLKNPQLRPLISEYYHNHPRNTPEPSGLVNRNRGDISHANWLDRENKISFGIFLPKYPGYIYYDKYSTKSEFINVIPSLPIYPK